MQARFLLREEFLRSGLFCPRSTERVRIISSRWVILSDIDREIIPGESLHTFQGIVSPPHQGSALVKNPDEAAFEEAKAHAEFLDKSMGGRA